MRTRAVRLIVAFAYLLWLCAPGPALAALPEFPVPGGYFFSETSGQGPAQGYLVTNEGGIPLWDEFQRLGGVDTLGFPVSNRYLQGGFVTQATQRQILQWRPDQGQVVFANVFDLMSQLGLDDHLLRRGIPKPLDNAVDVGKPFPQVRDRHLAYLNSNPAIRQRYLADSDPLGHFGLPQSYADLGNVFVMRCQRAVLQQWRVATPFAAPGDVTVANAGEIARDLGVVPAAAAAPIAAGPLVVAPQDGMPLLDAPTLARVRGAASQAQPAVGLVAATLDDGSLSLGTGTIFDRRGFVMTNQHVVQRAVQLAFQPGGRDPVPATLLGTDSLTDLAVLRVALPNPPTVPIAAGPALRSGQVVVAYGYTDMFPAPPTVRVGTVQSLEPDVIEQVISNVYIGPGDSGGPLLNLDGQLVGINAAAMVNTLTGQELASYSISIGSAQPLLLQLATQGHVQRAYLGVVAYPTRPPARGLLLVSVGPGSPAAAAGLRPGDTLLALDNQPLNDLAALVTVLNRHRAGDAITAAVLGADGARRTVTVTVTDQP